jgi:PTS system glucose-specific IIC component
MNEQLNTQVKTQKNKGAFKEVVAKLSRGLMLPIAMLPIAGLFLGLGSTINNLSNSEAMSIFGKIFQIPGNIIFSSLPVLFAIAIAISFTKDSGTAGLSAMVGWLIFNAIQFAFIINPPVKETLNPINGTYHFLWYKFGAT